MSTDRIRLLLPVDVALCARAVFTCTSCGSRAAVGVPSEVVDRLLACDVPVSHGHPSLGRRGRRLPAGPPFTHDDLLDFHLLLARDDWFDQLVGASTR